MVTYRKQPAVNHDWQYGPGFVILKYYYCPVGEIVRKKSGLLYPFDNKTLKVKKSNFTLILFYKK
jgi:hypothetical protein